jgi:hypothetical protein
VESGGGAVESGGTPRAMASRQPTLGERRPRVASDGIAGEESSLMWVVAGGNVGARRSAAVLLHLWWKARLLVPTAEDGDTDLWGRRRVESRTGGWSRGWEDGVVVMRNSIVLS